jgi:hypothetical protein
VTSFTHFTLIWTFFSAIYQGLILGMEVSSFSMRFDAFIVVPLKITVLWDVAVYSLLNHYQHFRGTYWLHLSALKMDVA